VKSSTPHPISLSLGNRKKKWMCVNWWSPMFLTCLYAFWHPMHLKGLRVNGKQLGSTTWTSSSTYIINYFFYIYIVCYCIDIFLSLSHLKISTVIVCVYTWWSVQGYSWCYWIIKDSGSMARIPVQHLVLLVGKTFVIFVFCLFNPLCLLFTCNIIFTYTMFI
jgi:hypothetical protein